MAEQGGAVEAVPYMKTQLVESHRERVRRIETGELKVVGQNAYTHAEPSPLQEGEDGGILRVNPAVEGGGDRRPRRMALSPRPGGRRCCPRFIAGGRARLRVAT